MNRTQFELLNELITFERTGPRAMSDHLKRQRKERAKAEQKAQAGAERTRKKLTANMAEHRQPKHAELLASDDDKDHLKSINTALTHTLKVMAAGASKSPHLLRRRRPHLARNRSPNPAAEPAASRNRPSRTPISDRIWGRTPLSRLRRNSDEGHTVEEVSEYRLREYGGGRYETDSGVRPSWPR